MLGTLALAALTLTSALVDDEEYQQGVALYEELEFEQGLIRLRRAAANSELIGAERAQVFVWIALCYAGLSDRRGAEQALLDALREDPDVVLPDSAPPLVRDLFSEAQAVVDEGAGDSDAQVDADAVAAPPDNTTPLDSPPHNDPLPLSLLAGGALGATGGLISLVGVGVGVLAAVTLAEGDAARKDPANFQSDVADTLDRGTLEAAIAGGLLVSGVGAAAGGVGLMIVGLSE